MQAELGQTQWTLCVVIVAFPQPQASPSASASPPSCLYPPALVWQNWLSSCFCAFCAKGLPNSLAPQQLKHPATTIVSGLSRLKSQAEHAYESHPVVTRLAAHQFASSTQALHGFGLSYLQDCLSCAPPRGCHLSEQGLLRVLPCKWARSTAACTPAVSVVTSTLWVSGRLLLSWHSTKYAKLCY